MTPRTLLIFLLILIPRLALGEGFIRVSVPDGMNTPIISIYAENAPLDAPVALISGGENVELPDGNYVYGIDSFAWRSRPFSHVGETTLTFGALDISAPDGVEARFTVHGTDKGALMLPVNAGTATALPSGEFELRRDLASLAWPLDVRVGKTTQMPLGAITLSGAIEGDLSVYVAAQDVDLIAGVIFPGNEVLALPEGKYRLRSLQVRNIASTNVESGKITVVPSTLARFWSAEGSGGLTLSQGAIDIQINDRTSGDILFLGDDPVMVDVGGEDGPLKLPNTDEVWVWQKPDGSLVQDTGITLTWAGTGEMVAVPGRELPLKTEFGRAAQAWVRLWQGENLIQKTNINVPLGVSVLAVVLPAELSEDIPLGLVLTTGPEGAEIEGRISEIPVHKFISDPPSRLAVVAATTTSITLEWNATSEGGVVGYRVYRGQSKYAVSGRNPVAGSQFADIALSAGREYTYRVCPVDSLGFDGPCSTVSTRTEYSR